jgi:hypothetical protein
MVKYIKNNDPAKICLIAANCKPDKYLVPYLDATHVVPQMIDTVANAIKALDLALLSIILFGFKILNPLRASDLNTFLKLDILAIRFEGVKVVILSNENIK